MNIEEKIDLYRKNGFPKIWVSDLGNGFYKNPILHTDYSDPDVICVGDDFYMTASSFNNVPGLPILHSKDLVNWKVINYAILELPFDIYDTPQYGKAVWAPSIRYHNNYFYIYVGFPDEGIFMTRTKNPYEKWEPLVCLKKTKGFIDVCPFWDDDGQAYLVNAFAKSRIGFKGLLAIHKMNYEGTELLDDFRIVYDGNPINHTVEGPKFYKRNDFYYISAPAGGVSVGWQLVLRSKNIYGPYEEKKVLHQGNTDINGPHQGGFVDLENGDSWFIHFQDKDAYGRIVHLQPMKWVDDWPVMGIDCNNDMIGEPVSIYKKPIEKNEIITQNISDDFIENTMGLQWQWNSNIKNHWFSLDERESHLRLFCINNGQNLIYDIPNILTFKFPALQFSTTVKIELSLLCSGEKFGLVVLGKTYNYISIVKGNKENYYINLTEGLETLDRHVEIVKFSQIANSNIIYFKVEISDFAICKFYYSYDGDVFFLVGEEFKAHTNEWVGCKIGLFSNSSIESKQSGHADIDWVLVEEI